MIAVRDGDARVVRRGDKGGNARHHLEGNLRRREFLGLLAAPSENVRVAALQPHDGLAFLRFRDEQLVQLLLRDGVGGSALAPVDELGGLGREAEQILIDECVIDHDIRASEQLGSTPGKQPHVARPRSN